MADDSSKVGYKAPPKRTQFKPGHSGNPSGRPKGSKNKKEFSPLGSGNIYEFQKQFVDAGYEEIQVIKDGVPQFMNKIDALLSKLYSKAMGGDLGASKIILQHTQSSLKDLEIAAHNAYRATIKMREDERKKIFRPPAKPNTHGALLEYVHKTYSARFAMREMYGKDNTQEVCLGEPEREEDWQAYNKKTLDSYREMGDEPHETEIPEIPSMFKL